MVVLRGMGMDEAEEILRMYEPQDRYILHPKVGFPELETRLWFSDDASKYKNEGRMKDKIQRDELTDICDQAGIILYRDAIMHNVEGMPRFDEKKISGLHTYFRPVRQDVHYRIFDVPRIRGVHKLKARHLDIVNYKGNYFLTYNVKIEKFFDADIQKELHFNDDDKYITKKVLEF